MKNKNPLSHRNSVALFYLLALVLLGLDQATKLWVMDTLPFGQPNPAIEPWLYFTHVHNDGAAFSILRGQKWILSAIALGVSAWIAVHHWRLPAPSRAQVAGLAFVWAGAVGNVIDRLRLGYVIDFLDLHWQGRNIWPIFNVADICINIGVALLILYFWTHPEEQTDAQDSKVEPTQEEEEAQTLSDAS